MPKVALHILLGNLIKNSFTHIEQGEVRIIASMQEIQVIDTGPGIASTRGSNDGFGLGLLLVKDICHRYAWEFVLEDNVSTTGCIARLQFPTELSGSDYYER